MEQEALALSNREQIIRELAENLQEAIWIQDLTTRKIVYVSPAYERIWGRSRQTLLESPESPLESIHPDDRERAWRRVARLADGEPVQEEYRILRPDGTIRWVQVTTSPVQVGHGRLVGMATDITGWRRTQDENRRLSILLDEAQSLARVGGWELDLVENTLYWTDETFRIHDTSREDYTPTVATALDFYPGEYRATIAAAMQEAIATGTGFDLELELLTAKGRRLWVHTTARATRSAGRTERIIGAFQDITPIKRMEEERRALEAEVLHNQKLESLGHLAGGVAHDMNNVLAAILGMTSALQLQYAHDPALAKALDTIHQAGNRGRDLVRGLTNFAHKGLGQTQQVDLNELVRNELELLDRTTLQRLRLRTDLEPGLPPILGEASALANVLMNLSVNARDAMPDGGTLTFATRALATGQVELSLTDTGQGMAPEVAAKAMEPFYTTKPLGQGTGLGLAMVYGTMKAHQGTVELQTALGEGTTVVLRFPTAAAIGVQAPVRGGAAAHPRGAALRILLVDDDELIRASAPLILEYLGHTVTVAEGGLQALEALASGPAVDLVLLDHNMPGLKGSETALRLRERHPDLPVLLATGHADASVSACEETVPRVWILLKPYSLEDIQAKLREIFP